jgi:lactoylglutathione lyase
MIRVKNLDESVKFYTELLGMKEIRRTDVPDGKYTLVFVGYGDESSHTVLELTYNYGVDSYDQGTAFGHLALGVSDIKTSIEALRAAGAKIVREPGPVKFGKTVIAFIEDPNGYKIELIER